MDEKSQIQELDWTASMLAMQPGCRHQTCALFAVLEIANGTVKDLNAKLRAFIQSIVAR